MQSILLKGLRRLRASENHLLMLLAVAVGLATGVAVWGFRAAIEFFTLFFHETLARDVLAPVIGAAGIVVALALGGFLVGWLMQRFVGQERHAGVAGVIEAVALGGGRLRYARMPFKALASALSLGAGASAGPEAPSVQIGANIGSMFGQRLRLSEDRVRLLVAAGGASAIAAAFRAPIAGVFFALEVILNGEFTTSSFGVVVLAAVISSVATQAIEVGGPELGIRDYTLGGLAEIPLYILLGLLLAFVAAAFIRVVVWQHDLWHRYLPLPRPLKTALAGALVGAVALFLPQIMGAGRDTMNTVLNTGDGEFTIAFLLALGAAKLLMTSVSLAGGFVGGIFAPVLFVGTVLGGAFGRIVVGLLPVSLVGNPQGYAIAGMAAMMGGVVRAPITAVILVFELTNDYRLILPIMLTTVICVYLTERLQPDNLEAVELARRGIRLQQGREIDLMQSVRVHEAMTTPAPTLPKSASLTELRDALRRWHARALCVTDDSGRMVGVVTLSDLQRAYERGAQAPQTVSDMCSRDVVAARPDEPLWTAIRAMGARGFASLPVVEAGTDRLLGMVSRDDVMRAYNAAIARKLEDQHQAAQARLNALTGARVLEFYVASGSPAAGRRIRDLAFPAESVAASVRRGVRLVVPHGSTELQAGDVVTIVAAQEAEPALRALFQAGAQ